MDNEVSKAITASGGTVLHHETQGAKAAWRWRKAAWRPKKGYVCCCSFWQQMNRLQEEGDKICCEGCDSWYHSTCVNTPKEAWGEKLYLVMFNLQWLINCRCFIYHYSSRWNHSQYAVPQWVMWSLVPNHSTLKYLESAGMLLCCKLSPTSK